MTGDAIGLQHSPMQSAKLLTGILRSVSRSFYLTLRILPTVIRPQISLAYLLARIADTIADTDLVTPSKRLHILSKWGESVAGRRSTPIDLIPFVGNHDQSPENQLLARAPDALQLLDAMPDGDSELIRTVLATIISGQALDLERFLSGSADHITFLDSEQGLDEYLYRVAGCVGEFWTRLCFRHLEGMHREPTDGQLRLAIQFGKGLQLVNILRDLHTDHKNGRCYLPEETVAQFLPSRKHFGRPSRSLQRLIEHYIQQARSFLTAGWEYTVQLPANWKRVRLACSWPLMIGFETLNSLPVDDPFNSARRAKITRKQVRSIMVRTILFQPLPKQWERLVLTGSARNRADL